LWKLLNLHFVMEIAVRKIAEIGSYDDQKARP
jgi:hypothetical protein